jgi:hypothetical protein
MRKIVVALAALAFVAPSSAHALAFVGARVGYAMPSGDAQKDQPMKDTIASGVPIQIDAGLSVLNILSVGIYGSYGPTQFKSQCVSCTGGTTRGGLQLNLRPPLVLKSLWGGVFGGFERQTVKNSSFKSNFTGWEAGLQAGWDFSILPFISVGPYASYSFAQFTSAGGDATLGTKAQHNAFTIGLRGLFDL